MLHPEADFFPGAQRVSLKYPEQRYAFYEGCYSAVTEKMRKCAVCKVPKTTIL